VKPPPALYHWNEYVFRNWFPLSGNEERIDEGGSSPQRKEAITMKKLWLKGSTNVHVAWNF
jgi:hypothetical protein